MAAWTRDDVTTEGVSIEAVRSLLDPPTPPCLSLYLPTHRTVPENRSDRPRFEHLVESLGLALDATQSRDDRERLLSPLQALAADSNLWRRSQEGLAVFAAGGHARVFQFRFPVRPLALIGARFHTLPLLGAVSSVDEFHVLSLTTRSARAWSGCIWHDPHADASERLDPIALASGGREPVEELRRSEVISEETREPHRVKHGMGESGRSATAFVHGGFGSRHDDLDHDTEIFFRHVDEVVAEQVSRPRRRPLVLVAAPQAAATFCGISANPFLLDEYVGLDPHLLTADELSAAVMPVLRQSRDQRVAREISLFEMAREHDRGSGDLAEIARAAVAGQVATLLVSADRLETGRFDQGSGSVVFVDAPTGDLSRTGDQPAVDGEDLYGAVAEAVFSRGGTVVMLAPHEMPTETGVAAIFRYA